MYLGTTRFNDEESKERKREKKRKKIQHINWSWTALNWVQIKERWNFLVFSLSGFYYYYILLLPDPHVQWCWWCLMILITGRTQCMCMCVWLTQISRVLFLGCVMLEFLAGAKGAATYGEWPVRPVLTYFLTKLRTYNNIAFSLGNYYYYYHYYYYYYLFFFFISLCRCCFYYFILFFPLLLLQLRK